MKNSIRILLLFLLFSGTLFAGTGGAYLGTATRIAIGTGDLKASLDFWKKLGFRVLKEQAEPMPAAEITDGSLLLLLTQDKEHYTTICYFNARAEALFRGIEEQGTKVPLQVRNSEGNLLHGIIYTPDSIPFKIINEDPGKMYQPDGPTMLSMKTQDLMNPEKMPNKACGVFGEFSYPVGKLEAEMDFLKKLGFKDKGINTVPYRWTIMTDGMNLIGLHETKTFSAPAITYFAPDMPERLKALEGQGIKPTEIGMGPGNVLIVSPEGTRIFLFTL